MKKPPKDQCIVLPLRPLPPQRFNGIGLALHFLIGNILVLHTNLKEMWFGWRVRKIFPEASSLKRYCRQIDKVVDLQQLADSQKIRNWIYGSFTNQAAEHNFFDQHTRPKKSSPIQLPISTGDGLIEFRQKCMDWFASLGWPMPTNQVKAALWKEEIGSDGLDIVGRSLETLYLYSYGGEKELELTPFKKAVAVAPNSFMALDLYGWALYRNRNYKAAHDAFLASIAINPAGAGAMSGLMWCGVYDKDLEEAMFWSGRKADVCGKDVEEARNAGRKRYDKIHTPIKKE